MSLLKTRLENKAGRNMTVAMAMGIRSGHLSAKAAIGIWKALVRPVLEYGAEVWGEGEWKDAEIIQRKMGRRILGRRGKSTDETILGELGWWTMQARRWMLRLRYWRKLISEMGPERLPRKVYNWERRSGRTNSWTKQTEEIMEQLGLAEVWKRQDTGGNKEDWEKLLNQRIQEHEQKRWEGEMKRKTKLRTYIKFKKELRQEKYLEDEDSKGRRLLARIRSGTNSLRIETGRHNHTPLERRICYMCGVEVEDELHFLMRCVAYEDIRKECLDDIGRKQDDPEVEEIMFGNGSGKEIKEVIRFVKRANSRRTRVMKLLGR